jgi:CAAX protease family protein
MHLRLKRVHLPSFGVSALLLGGVLRVFSSILLWPYPLVFASNIILLLSLAWIVMFDFFPIFLPVFYHIRTKYKRRYSFFFALVAFFALMQAISYFLPSGRVKDITTTIAFLSFFGSIVWAMGAYLTFSLTPVVKYIKRKPKEVERITFSDVITSMAIILVPTVVLSFLLSPPGLSQSFVTPTQVFISSLLTNVFMLAYLYLLVIRTHVFTWKQLGLKRVNREDLTQAFLLFVLVSIFIVILQQLFHRFGIPLTQYSFSTKENAWLVILVSVLVTPLVEELYFRGFLFRGLLLHHKPWIAYAASAMIFALLHPPLVVMIEVFIIGLLLAYVTQQTKSIWPNVLIHALNNALVMGYLLLR